jgi:hypothetical protein
MLFLVIAGICFGNVVSGGFVYDDIWVIEWNPTLRESSQMLRQFVLSYHHQQPSTGLYRPLTLISFSIQLLLQNGPGAFHVVNILLHALNTLLVFWLIRALNGTQRLAFVTGLLFLLLPIHTEAVSSIAGRADLLALTLGLSSVLTLLGQRYWLSAACFAGALFAKESAAGLAPVIAALAYVRYRPDYRLVGRILARFVACGLLYVVLRVVALGRDALANDAAFVFNPLKFVDPVTRLATALKVMVLYFWKSLVPVHLSADYSFDQITLIHHLWHPYAVIGLAVLGGLLALILHPRRAQLPAYAAFFFLSTFLIVSNFVVPIGTIMAERAFYMPSVALCFFLATVFDQALRRRHRQVWLAVGVIACGYYAWRIVDRNQVWLTREALFVDTVEQSERSVHARTNLAGLYIEQGNWSAAKALVADVKAPDHVALLDIQGALAGHEKRWDDAERIYLRALELRPKYSVALTNLRRLDFERGRDAAGGPRIPVSKSLNRLSENLSASGPHSQPSPSAIAPRLPGAARGQ